MYVTADRSLPRSLDVQISLARPQTETRTDLSKLVIALEGLGFFPDASRVRFYSTIEAVEDDFAAGTEAHFAASAFFSQTPRAQTMALGEVFLDPQPALLAAGVLSVADLDILKLVADGSMTVAYNPDKNDSGSAVALEMTGLDFTGITSIEDVASVINAATDAGLTAYVKTLPGGAKHLVISTVATGDNVVVTFPIEATLGTFVGAALRLSAVTGGRVMNGYTPTGIAGELANISNAANNSGEYLYGWALGASLRDVDMQIEVAEWILSRTAVTCLVTNDLVALDPSYTFDMGYQISAAGNRRVVPIYHDNPQRYPDVSILAYMLHVNYRIEDSTVTAKFKVLPGIETVQLTESEWIALKNKGYNTYTAIGNDARTWREGAVAAAGWFMDTVINLDNFLEDLSVNVYNVFLRNKKVPFTRRGQMLLVDACQETGNQYIFNGTFADREVQDLTSKDGIKIDPAVEITPVPIAMSSAADRAERIGPPIQMVVQEAGAIHSIAINVDVVS